MGVLNERQRLPVLQGEKFTVMLRALFSSFLRDGENVNEQHFSS
jgi:hypothetical protein